LRIIGKTKEALRNGEAVRVLAPEVGDELVLLRGEDFARIKALLEDEREKAAWAGLARKAAGRWAQEKGA
jgi:hypothetical protein